MVLPSHGPIDSQIRCFGNPPRESASRQVGISPERITLFVEEYHREAALIAKDEGRQNLQANERITKLEREIGNLAANFAQRIVSPTLARMLQDKEAELARLQHLASNAPRAPQRSMPDSDALARLYREKVANLTRSLEDEAIRPQASSIIRQIIHSVTIYPSVQPEAEVAAELGRLIDFAANENSPGFGGRGCSMRGLRGPDLPLRAFGPSRCLRSLCSLRPNSRVIHRTPEPTK